jgi:hypothetical protein
MGIINVEIGISLQFSYISCHFHCNTGDGCLAFQGRGRLEKDSG